MSHPDPKFPEVPDLLSLMTAESGQVLPHVDSLPSRPGRAPTTSDDAVNKADEELVLRRRARRERRKLANASDSAGTRTANQVALSPAAQVVEQEFLSVKQLARHWSVGVATIWRWSALNVIPKPVALGPGTTRWRIREIKAHEASRQKDGSQ